MDKAAGFNHRKSKPKLSSSLWRCFFHHALPIHSSSKSDRRDQQCYQLYTALFHRLSLNRHSRFQKGQAQCQRAMHYWNTPSEPASTTGTLLCAFSNMCILPQPVQTQRADRKHITTCTFLLLQEDRAKQHSNSFILYERVSWILFF